MGPETGKAFPGSMCTMVCDEEGDEEEGGGGEDEKRSLAIRLLLILKLKKYQVFSRLPTKPLEHLPTAPLLVQGSMGCHEMVIYRRLLRTRDTTRHPVGSGVVC